MESERLCGKSGPCTHDCWACIEIATLRARAEAAEAKLAEAIKLLRQARYTRAADIVPNGWADRVDEFNSLNDPPPPSPPDARQPVTGEALLDAAEQAFLAVLRDTPESEMDYSQGFRPNLRAVLAAVTPLIQQAQRERDAKVCEAKAAAVNATLYFGNDMPKHWAASLHECAAAIRGGEGE